MEHPYLGSSFIGETATDATDSIERANEFGAFTEAKQPAAAAEAAAATAAPGEVPHVSRSPRTSSKANTARFFAFLFSLLVCGAAAYTLHSLRRLPPSPPPPSLPLPKPTAVDFDNFHGYKQNLMKSAERFYKLWDSCSEDVKHRMGKRFLPREHGIKVQSSPLSLFNAPYGAMMEMESPDASSPLKVKKQRVLNVLLMSSLFDAATARLETLKLQEQLRQQRKARQEDTSSISTTDEVPFSAFLAMLKARPAASSGGLPGKGGPKELGGPQDHGAPQAKASQEGGPKKGGPKGVPDAVAEELAWWVMLLETDKEADERVLVAVNDFAAAAAKETAAAAAAAAAVAAAAETGTEEGGADAAAAAAAPAAAGGEGLEHLVIASTTGEREIMSFSAFLNCFSILKSKYEKKVQTLEGVNSWEEDWGVDTVKKHIKNLEDENLQRFLTEDKHKRDTISNAAPDERRDPSKGVFPLAVYLM